MPNSLRMASRSSLVNRYRPVPISPTLAKVRGTPKGYPGPGFAGFVVRPAWAAAGLSSRSRKKFSAVKVYTLFLPVHGSGIATHPMSFQRADPSLALAALRSLRGSRSTDPDSFRAEDPRFARAGLSGRL